MRIAGCFGLLLALVGCVGVPAELAYREPVGADVAIIEPMYERVSASLWTRAWTHLIDDKFVDEGLGGVVNDELPVLPGTRKLDVMVVRQQGLMQPQLTGVATLQVDLKSGLRYKVRATVSGITATVFVEDAQGDRIAPAVTVGLAGVNAPAPMMMPVMVPR